MTYLLQHSDAEHFTTLESALSGWIKGPQDLFIVSRDGGRVYSQQALISLYSPQLAGILAGAKDICPGVSVEASFASITTLVDLLTYGKAATKDEKDLEECNNAAALLGINLSNLAIERLTLKEKKIVELSSISNSVNKSKVGRLVSVTNNQANDNEHIEPIIVKIAKINGDIKTSPSRGIISKVMSCSGCLKQFKNRKGLKRHKTWNCKGAVDEYPKLYQCNKCVKSFDRKPALKAHKMIHKQKQDLPYKCNECGKTFAQAGNLKVHAKNRHDTELSVVKRREDVEQSESSEDETILMNGEYDHIDSSSIMGENGDEEDNGEYSLVDSLIKEGNVDTEIVTRQSITFERVKCDACYKLFDDKPALEKHLRNWCKGEVEDSSSQLHTCEGCGKTFSLKQSLRRHHKFNRCKRKRVYSPKLFECDECGKGFTLKGSLKRHKTLHTGDLSCGCEVCGKTFARPDHLRVHARSQHGIELPPAMNHEDGTDLMAENQYEHYEAQGYTASSHFLGDFINGDANVVNQEEDMEESEDYDIDEEIAYPAVSLVCEDNELDIEQEIE